MRKGFVVSKKLKFALTVACIIAFVICSYYFFVLPAPPRWAWALLIAASLLNLFINMTTYLNKTK